MVGWADQWICSMLNSRSCEGRGHPVVSVIPSTPQRGSDTSILKRDSKKLRNIWRLAGQHRFKWLNLKSFEASLVRVGQARVAISSWLCHDAGMCRLGRPAWNHGTICSATGSVERSGGGATYAPVPRAKLYPLNKPLLITGHRFTLNGPGLGNT